MPRPPRPGSGAPSRSPDTVPPEERIAAYLRSRRGSLSHNTERAIRADVQVFLEWLAKREFKALPAEASTVAAFLTDMARDKAPSTVRRYAYSLSTLHKATGGSNPVESEQVKNVLRRLAPGGDDAEDGVIGLTWPLCQRLIEASGERLIDSRNRALLAVSYDALLRRSELVAMCVADLVVVGEASATLLAPRGWSDAVGKGVVLRLPSDTLELVSTWLRRSDIKGGRLFRSLRKNESLGEELGASQVARIFKDMALQAGVPPEVARRLSGHSPRVGAVQDMIASGVQLPEIMRVGRWKSAAMVQRYGQRLLAGRGDGGRLVEFRPKDSFHAGRS